jgi:hypothetical protein
MARVLDIRGRRHREDYKPCPGNGRHWFSEYGSAGFVVPMCVRCGAPNPRWERYAKDMGLTGDVEEAIRLYKAGRLYEGG